MKKKVAVAVGVGVGLAVATGIAGVVVKRKIDKELDELDINDIEEKEQEQAELKEYVKEMQLEKDVMEKVTKLVEGSKTVSEEDIPKVE